MKSPLIKFVGMAAWLITAICALHVGMKAMGHDLFMRFGLENNPTVTMWAEYIAGIAGLISLIMFVMAVMCRHPGVISNSKV